MEIMIISESGSARLGVEGKTMRNTIIGLLALVIVSALPVFAGPSVERVTEDSRIDWTNNLFVATGEGIMPPPREEPNRARAYLKAKGYARMAAIANLLMAIEGTSINFEATGKDYMEEAVIRQKIEGFVRNVTVVAEERKLIEGDTVIIVKVQSPMYGARAPGTVLMKKAIEMETTAPPAEVTVDKTLDARLPSNYPRISPGPSAPGKPYTSLIIDTTGFALDRCMSPKIRRGDGTEVWGTVKVDPELVLEKGIVSYAVSLSAAKNNARCGSNPLIVRAIGCAGGRFNSDPVVSDADAELIASENALSGFLDKLNVIIVEDGRL